MVKKEVEEWILRADKDLEEAKFLLENNRPLENAAYFVHQSIEKYLKAFLISNGWEFEKIHDLVKLTRDAVVFDKSLESFVPAVEKITDFYIESRYPVGYEVEYTKEEIENALEIADSRKAIVKERTVQ